ncbi:MAG: choice-of-anchor D domain-containing protein, partial [Chloroflexi bacterium]
HDFGDASYYGWSTSTYRLAASAGATTVNGTWASASGAVGTVTVAAAYKPAGGGTPTPAVTLSPTSLVFGAQAVGTTSASQSVTLTNSGTGPVTITSITVAGTNAADFGRTTTCPLSPTTLAAGASRTIGATFAPAAAGARAASIQVADNATGSPHTVALSGTGTAPAVTLTPTNLVFGSQLVGTTSASQSSTLRNSGTASLTIASITVVGANAGEFGQTNDCPVSLAANATCTITVTFSPSATGSRAATVQISDNAVGSPHALTLSGTGATPVPAVTLSPTSLAFGSQLVGTTSASQSSTLKNTGTGPMTITSIGLTGANAGDFGQSNSCPGSLAANATCTITVTFSPTVSGGRAASVSIADDAPGTPHTIPLSGNGTTPAPAVMLTPTSLTFASQLVGRWP